MSRIRERLFVHLMDDMFADVGTRFIASNELFLTIGVDLTT